MLRTQIYLPYAQVRALKEAAAEGNTSVSEVVRQSIDNTLIKKKKIREKYKNTGEWLLSLALDARKRGVEGPHDLAKNMDKYLYDKDFR